jgi:hypothetical protein
MGARIVLSAANRNCLSTRIGTPFLLTERTRDHGQKQASTDFPPRTERTDRLQEANSQISFSQAHPLGFDRFVSIDLHWRILFGHGIA